MSEWIDIGSVNDIPSQGARTVIITGQRIAVFRTIDNRIFALEDRCPHKHGPLSQGIVHGHWVTCPLHNWKIALASGEAQGDDTGCTQTIAVRTEGERILLARPMRAAA